MAEEEAKPEPEQKIEVATPEEVDQVKKEIEKDENSGSNLIEEARKVNQERREILDREEKLQARREKLHAEQMVAGKGQMTEGNQQEETPQQYKERMMAGGMHGKKSEV